MRRHHPDPQMSIPVTLLKYQQLLGASNSTGFEKEDWEIAAEAIDDWLRRHHPDAIPMPTIKGYQWKSVFLPDGTLLRTVFGGKNHHCLIEDDKVLYNGQPVSPSQFVNAVGGVRRNAWRCTWILFPDTKEWKLADTLRGRARPKRTAKQAPVLQQGPSTQCGVSLTPVAVAPVSEPVVRAPLASAAPSVTDAPSVQPASGDSMQCPSGSGGGLRLQPRTDTILSQRHCPRGTDRRTSGNCHLAAMLRAELQPLLHHICTLHGSCCRDLRPPGPASGARLGA